MPVPVLSIFAGLSLLTVFTALVFGTREDIATRRVPRWLWMTTIPIPAVSTLFWYIETYLIGYVLYDIQVFLVSAILCGFCVFMGYRMGNGGDWRSLFYVSLLTPWVAMGTLLGSALVGIVQIWIGNAQYGRGYKSPWMISITTAFGICGALYALGFRGYFFI